MPSLSELFLIFLLVVAVGLLSRRFGHAKSEGSLGPTSPPADSLQQDSKTGIYKPVSKDKS